MMYHLKALVVALCIFSSSLFGSQIPDEIPTSVIENLNITYSNGEGAANSQLFIYEGIDYGTDFSVFLQGGELTLSSESESLRLNSLPEQVTGWESLDVKSLNLTSDKGLIDFNVARVDYKDNKGEIGALVRPKIKCETLNKDLSQSFLELCLENKTKIFLSSMKGVDISGLNIWLNKGRMNFSLKNSVKIKGEGRVFYDRENQQVRIRIDKARAGILNVIGRVFSELSALESEYINVNRPWITLSLKQ